MKTRIKGLFISVATLLSACTNTNTEMKTVVLADGSCYREITATVDSFFMVSDSSKISKFFPVELDTTWVISWKIKNNKPCSNYPLTPLEYDSLIALNDKKPFEVTIRKNFKQVRDLTTQFKWKKDNQWSDLEIKHELDKKFRWFYTYYTFREIYPQIKTNFDVPLDSFMTKDESNFWLTGTPNLLIGMNGVEIREFTGELEDKFTKWYFLNIWHQHFNALLSNFDSIASPPVDKSTLISLRDSIYKTEVVGNEDIEFKEALSRFFDTQAFSSLWATKNSPMSIREKELEEEGFERYLFHSIKYSLIMPGKILAPTNSQINDNTLTCQITAFRMLNGTYTLEARSRKANVWAFIVSGLIVVASIGSLVYKPKKKE